MSQKEFSQRTGIAESTISDWKKKNNNPVSDKVLIICEVLGVTPYELLSGAEGKGTRSRKTDTYVVNKGSELGVFLEVFQSLDSNQQKRVMGYAEAISEMNQNKIQMIRCMACHALTKWLIVRKYEAKRLKE